MTSSNRKNGPWIAFLIGALAVVVVLVSYAAYTSGRARNPTLALNLRPAIHAIPDPTPAPEPAPIPLPLPRPPA